jgi:cyclophilin family peptidyl-prolyl cis-trans isomerase
MKFIRILVSLSLFAFALSLVSAQTAQTPQAICDAAGPGELTEMKFDAPEQVLEAGVDYRAIFCTSAGAIYIDLFEDQTPITVNNFVFLAQQSYYDGTTFHRVMESFMAQGGDPTATGTSGPGYQFEDEPVGFLIFDQPGKLAMANSGPATNGSQFFITTAPTPHLNYKHTILGDVLEGQENVVNIRLRDPQSDPNPGEALDAVIIVTDPSTVDSSYEILDPATQEDVVAAFDAILATLPPSIVVDEEVSGLSTTEETIGSVPEAFQADFATFTETYGHQYRYGVRLLNGECDPNQFFTFLGYSIDVFDSAEGASGALVDDFPNSLATGNGFVPLDGTDRTYSLIAQTCSGGDGMLGMALYTRGRYLVTIQTLIPVEILQQVEMNALLEQVIPSLFENAMGPIYLPELRSE